MSCNPDFIRRNCMCEHKCLQFLWPRFYTADAPVLTMCGPHSRTSRAVCQAVSGQVDDWHISRRTQKKGWRRRVMSTRWQQNLFQLERWCNLRQTRCTARCLVACKSPQEGVMFAPLPLWTWLTRTFSFVNRQMCRNSLSLRSSGVHMQKWATNPCAVGSPTHISHITSHI